MSAVIARSTRTKSPKTSRKTRDAATLAKGQRDISISEFFAKNRHLLGFDNPRKALLTSIKEAVDNALDACEESGILPKLFIGIEQLDDTRFRATVRDNGPGILRSQVENIFGKLLYGSKFHRMKMSRGQQGIGISAAGMYGLMTTGKPMVIHTKSGKNKPCHKVVLAINTNKNKADVTDEEERYDFEHDTGTEVSIEMEGKYNRGRQSIDEYLEQTAIANPHCQIIYQPPTACRPKDDDISNNVPSLIDDYQHALKLIETVSGTTITPGGTIVYPRTVNELPPEPKEIKPHPKGVELGMLLKMVKDTEQTKMGGFLQNSFCRVSNRIAQELTAKAGISNSTWTKSVTHADVEKLYKVIQETKLQAPPTNCLSPIGVKQILAGLLKGVKAEFYTAITRKPAVYRGNPFQIEVGLAYGGDIGSDNFARVIRFANRVPLLYQQSSCCAFKAILDTSWKNYGMSQSNGALPQGPLIIMIHMASVWVPFTSESKEAIADYDEIRKEIRLAVSECGRKLKTYVRRKQRIKRESERRGVFERYIGEVVKAMNVIDSSLNPDKLLSQFEAVAKKMTEEADAQFDDDGNLIKQKKDEGNGILDKDDATVIVDLTPPPVISVSAANAGDTRKSKKQSKTKRIMSRGRKAATSDDDPVLF